jgi:beta-hydroxyacyl-ACP dehydratase FabZ
LFFAEILSRVPRDEEREARSDSAKLHLVSINIPASLDRMCYRYPSALVDVVAEHEPGRRIVAYKNVTVSEEFFQGHFPGAPLMPGVLMIETLAQVATILLTQSGDDRAAARAYLRGVDNAKFRLPVVPGDRLRLEVTMGPRRARIARAHATAFIGDNVAAEADLVLGVVMQPHAATVANVTIHPTAVVHPDAVIGEGSVIGPHAVVGQHVGDWRRQRDFPAGLGRFDSAGPQVPR